MKIHNLAYLSVASILVSCGAKTITKDDVADPTSYQTVDEEHMDKNVLPSEDFFQFANGTWCKENPVPNSESRWGSFNELDKANKEKLVTILKNASANKGERGSQNQILGDYYASFMDFNKRNKAGLSGISEEIKWITSIDTKEELPDVIAKLQKNGISNTFSFGIGQDMKNVTQNIPNLYQGGIGLPNKDYYFNDDKKEILGKYTYYIFQMYQAMGHAESDSKKAAAGIVGFETMLAMNMMAPAEQRIPEKTYNRMPADAAKVLFAEFNFSRFLNTLGMDNLDEIVVGQPAFIQGIGAVYNKMSLAEWKNYLQWKVMDHYAGHLTSEVAQLNFDFYGKVLSGKKEMKPLEDQVIDEITGMSFSELLGKAFVDQHFSASAQLRVNEMVDNLLVVFDERIKGLSWMSPETKEEALKKLNSIGRKLGFPSEWQDFTSLNFTSDYLENVRKANQFAVNRNFNKLGKPVNKKEWGMPAHMVNAYYHPLLNEIAFPAGIMQPPFFSDQYEDAVNYGRIGMVIGHEFTHGFDDMGSKFAADGSFSNWWSEKDRKAFETKTGLFGQTYSAFCPIADHCVNPELTMGENIADLGGLTLAYYAYTKTREFKSGISRKGFTPAQRFFIAYAQLWKINYTEEELKNRLANDPHSPGMYRVNGPLKNCPEFFKAFDIKEGDKMRNPSGKVANIW